MIISGKDFLKSHILSWLRKVYSDREDVTSSGRAFQVFGPASGKTRLPTVDSELCCSALAIKIDFGGDCCSSCSCSRSICSHSLCLHVQRAGASDCRTVPSSGETHWTAWPSYYWWPRCLIFVFMPFCAENEFCFCVVLLSQVLSVIYNLVETFET